VAVCISGGCLRRVGIVRFLHPSSHSLYLQGFLFPSHSLSLSRPTQRPPLPLPRHTTLIPTPFPKNSLLFLATTDIFTYYYHLYLTGTPYSTPLNGTHTFNNKPTTTTTTPSTLDSNPTHAAHPLAQIPEIPPSLASTTYPAPTPDTAGTYAPHGHHGNGVPLLGGTHFENHGPGASAPVPEQVGGRPQTGYEGDGGMGGEGRGPGYSVV